MEATVVDGNGTETGHIIVTTIGGRNGQPKQVDMWNYIIIIASVLSHWVVQFKSPQGQGRFTWLLTLGLCGISRGVHKMAWTSTDIKIKKK